MQSPFDTPLSGIRSPFAGRRLGTAVSALAAYAVATFTPKLVFDFETETYATGGEVSTFDDSITFARASTATMVDSDGLLVEVASGVPRRGHHVYDGTSYVNEGLLVESEARTNLITYSEDFSNVDWTKNQMTVSADQVINGQQFWEITRTSNGLTRGVYQLFNFAAGETKTITAFAKKNSGEARLIMTDQGTGNAVNGTYDTSTGVATFENTVGWSNILVDMISVSANVFLCVLTAESDNTANDVRCGTAAGSSINDTTSMTAAQLEDAPTPSSYIPTSGATVTRAAETLTVPAAKLPYDDTNMSIQMEGRQTGDTNTMLRWYADASNYITQESGASDFTFEQAESGTVDNVTGGSFTSGVLQSFSIASTHASTLISGAVSGTALTDNTTPTALADLSATDMNLAYAFNGTMKKARIWDDDITEAGREESTS